MRACDGCRRRKIKCDSATTNTWPCAACVRLKLKCVPPTLSFESDQGESDKPHEEKTPDANLHHEASQSAMRPVQNSVPPQATMPVSAQYPQPMGLDQLAPYVQRQDSLQYSPVPPTVPQSLHYTPRLYTMEPAPAPAPQLNAPERHVAWTGEDALSMSNISDALGELQITYDAVGALSAAARSSMLTGQRHISRTTKRPLQTHRQPKRSRCNYRLARHTTTRCASHQR